MDSVSAISQEMSILEGGGGQWGEVLCEEGGSKIVFLGRRDSIRFTLAQPNKRTPCLSAGAGAEPSLCSGC